MNAKSFLCVSVLTLTGCSSPLLRPITSTILSGGGAAAGSILSDGHPGGAAAGAAVGTALSETFFHLKSTSERRAYQNGYQQARSDQMKEEYWRIQFLHRPEASPALQLPVRQPERITPDGVRLVPSTEIITLHP